MKLKTLTLSDIHLGHNNTITSDIIHQLDTFFIVNHKTIKDIDMLIISGDVFDRLLTTRSIEYRLSIIWLTKLLLWCKKYNVKLRILNGTPSHDHNQIEAFVVVASRLAPDADFKYFNTIEIEHIEKYNIDILYIPDEMYHDSKDTEKHVLNLLKEKNLAQVDFVILHGAFGFQLPILKDKPFIHKESFFLDITRYYIITGHVHSPNAYDRILIPGSFSRIAHGEEHPKGALLVEVDLKEVKMKFSFLENTLATIYKTIDLRNKEEIEIIKELPKLLKQIAKNSHVRLFVDNKNLIVKSIKNICSKYPYLTFKIKTEDSVDKPVDILDIKTKETFNITESNIEKLLLDNMNLNKEETKILKEELILIKEKIL